MTTQKVPRSQWLILSLVGSMVWLTLGNAGCSEPPPLDPTPSPTATVGPITVSPEVSPSPTSSPTPTDIPDSPTPSPSPTVPPGGLGELDVSANAVDFGTVSLGESAERTITISNLGTGPLDYSLSISNDVGGDFSLAPGQSESGQIDVSGLLFVTVEFSPSSAGAQSGSLVIGSNDADEPELTVTLSGEGFEPPLDDQDGDGVTVTTDCNDNDATIYPGAPEICDLKDNDCDTLIDEDGSTWFYLDNDGDGFGDPNQGLLTCNPGSDYASNSTDCDDTDNTTNPGAAEVCDFRDNDCDDQIDEGVTSTFYTDADSDGHGDPNQSTLSCFADAGQVNVGDDCDDQNAQNYPGNPEVCDGADNNCDGAEDEGLTFTTWYADVDADGYGNSSTGTPSCAQPEGTVSTGGDCNDANAKVHPNATEACDGIDNDCDTLIDEDGPTTFYVDSDKDGHGDPSTGQLLCNPGDGMVSVGDDCDDKNAARYPGNTEQCDTIDNDCDNQIDENVQSAFYQDADSDGFGTSSSINACQAPTGYAALTGDCNDSDNTINPSASESCNSKDDNCNGTIDEGVVLTWYRDQDGDGYGVTSDTQEGCTAPVGYASRAGDCDDARANVNPDAQEQCDGIDNDCDASIDEGLTTSVWYTDSDSDGYGTDNSATQKCSQPPGTAAQGGDCNDGDASIHPGATEACDLKDNDCDAQVDEGAKTSFYIDSDQDGYGASGSTPTQACTAPSGYVTDHSDCDDSKASVNPKASETCNSIDDDCDGLVDEGFSTQTYYQDADGDTYGNPNSTKPGCSQPLGYVTDNTDCDDTKASVNPKATETCNSIDDNCNGTADEGVTTSFYVDADKDGYGKGGSAATQACTAPSGYVNNNLDCDDTNANTKPGATELCNSLDDDCDGATDEGIATTAWYRDQDADTFGDPSLPMDKCSQPSGYVSNKSDCDDTNAAINPNATEVCDAKDNDCDGATDENVKQNFYVDADADKFGKSGSAATQACTAPSGYASNNTDCDDTNATVFPGAPEQCNSKDDNCNGIIDDGVVYSTWYIDSDADGYGSTASSKVACVQPAGYALSNTDCNDADKNVNPGATEVCNSKDDDCDAQIDEGVKTTYYADADKDGFGSTTTSQQACSAPSGYVTSNTDCNDADNTVYPGAIEQCDGKDNNCDTQVDEGAKQTYYKDGDGDGYGTSATTVQACSAPSGYVTDGTDCNDADAQVNPGKTEVCDSKDNDCDAQIDENVKTTYYADADADGYGSPFVTTQACTLPSGFSTNNTDCNDSAASINPGATEICDSIDNNCNGSTDEGVKGTYYVDADSDTYGDTSVSVTACSRPTGYVSVSGDCNDSDAAVNPAATEVCDGKDNNCNSQTDEGVKLTYYRDADSDTFGDPDASTQACTKPTGYVANNTDCDDTDASVYPGADEVRGNGIDEDCNGRDLPADLNQDGYGDMVIANNYNGSTTKINSYIYYGAATGVNATRTELPTLGAYSSCLADFDNDGDLDVFFVNYRSDTVYSINSYLYWNTPTGFTSGNPLELPSVGAVHCVATDLNSDGYIDLVLSNMYDGKIYNINSYVYMNSSSGFSTFRRFDLPTLGAYSASAEDLNGDGYKEIVFSNYRNASVYTQDSYLYWGSANGYSTSSRTSLASIGPWKPATISDVNSDGVLDIIMNNHYNGSSYNIDSYIYYGPDYTIGTRTAIPTNGNSGSRVEDLDHDGFKDIAVGSYYDGDNATNSFVYFGSSRGFSSTNRQSLPGNRVYDIDLYDFNEDGYSDILLGMYYDADYAVTSLIYLGSSTGYNTTNVWSMSNVGATAAEIVDLDQDTWPDVVLPSYYTGTSYSTSSYVYYGSARGIPNTALSALPTIGAVHVELSDLNSDGYPEAIYANSFDGTTYNLNSYVYWGKANGFSTANRTSLPTAGANYVCVDDLNKDGYKDIVFANNYNGTSRKIDSMIYWGGSTGYSTSNRTLLPTIGAYTCAIADLNKDGYKEVVFSNYYDGTSYAVDSYIYWNRSGVFATSDKTLLPTIGATGVVSADFDKNGYPDLFFSDYYNGTTYNVDSIIYFGDASGFSSSRRLTLAASGAQYNAVVDDLDGNGYLDIVINGYYDGDNAVNTYIYYGSASGYNTTNRATLAQNRTYSVNVADFNKDGYKDLLLNNYYDGDESMNTYIWLGSATGYSTSNRVTLATNRIVKSVVSDFNKDGWLDIAMANYYDGNSATSSYIWYGASTGYSTTNRVSIPTERAFWVAASDLDNDGLEDLVFAEQRSDSSYSITSGVVWNSERKFSPDNFQTFASVGALSASSAGAR